MKKILLFGSATADITLQIDHLPSSEEDLNPTHQKITLGGCACNVAMMMKLSDVPFTLAVPVGKGLYGDFVSRQLQERNIPIWKESEEENGSCTCLVTPDGNRTFLAVHGGEYHYQVNYPSLKGQASGNVELSYRLHSQRRNYLPWLVPSLFVSIQAKPTAKPVSLMLIAALMSRSR